MYFVTYIGDSQSCGSSTNIFTVPP
jgi:hypothetical protein